MAAPFERLTLETVAGRELDRHLRELLDEAREVAINRNLPERDTDFQRGRAAVIAELRDKLRESATTNLHDPTLAP